MLAWSSPLWLDESWSAMISASRTFTEFRRNITIDVGAPLYYLLIWLWPFETDFGLRVPSLLLSLGASFAAALWRPQSVSREAGLMWAALLLLWSLGFYFTIDVRPYSLLLLLSTLQTVAFVTLLERPTQAKAALWVGLSSAAILTHYYAAVVAGCEGVAYLWGHRREAVRTFPALLLLAPAVAWFAYRLPHLLTYAANSWYEPVGLTDWPRLLLWPLAGTAICAIGVVILAALFLRRPSPEIFATAAAGWIACALLVAAGLLRPMLVDRYLLPCAPPLLLGLAASVRWQGYLPIAAWILLNAGSPSALSSGLRDRANFGLEVPAGQLPHAEVVTWSSDSRGAELMDKRQAEAALTDAFARNGRTVKARWGTDLMAGDGLIWFYGRANEHRANQIRQLWRCRTRRGTTSTLVCERR